MFWNIKMLENTAECLFLCLYLITWEHAEDQVHEEVPELTPSSAVPFRNALDTSPPSDEQTQVQVW